MINKAILHVMNLNSGLCVYSQKVMESLSSEAIYTFIDKHIDKSINDATQQTGVLSADSVLKNNLELYCTDKMDFVELSTVIAEKLYERLSLADNQDPIDFLMADCSNENGEYIVLLLFNNKTAYTHQVSNDNGCVSNEIIRHYGILPSTVQKIESFAIVNKRDYQVGFADRKRMIEGQEVHLLQEVILQCSAKISAKEAIKTISKITKKVAEESGVNAAIAISKVKNYIAENAEVSTYLSPAELGKEIFADSEVLQSRFEEKLTVAELPQEIPVAKKLAVQTGKNHKIKTDTGIEITFPVDYFQNQDFLEFINNPDGTISIAIKNIGKITNR